MALLPAANPTLLDFALTLGTDDKVTRVIEILAQTNEILDDMVSIEGNLITGHRTTIRTGYPAPTWRKLYGGVQPTKSTVTQITESCGMLENYSEIDKALADLNNNSTAFMLSENRAILEGFNQEIAQSIFYASEDNEPEAFTGFAPRFNTSVAANAENAQNVLKAGGTGADNTSVWLVVWGESTVHSFYPKGSKGGFVMDNKGQVTVENVDGAGGRMEAYRTHYRWDYGLAIRDWRYVVRIANIDISDLTKTGATGADLIDLMTQALELVQALGAGRPAFYVNRTIKSFLRRQIVNKVAQSTLTMDTVAGRHVMTFDGVPVRRVDALVNNEALVP